MQILLNFLLAIHVIVSLLIVFVVLMQRPKSEGLGAAFGGGMTDNLFGAQTTNVLQNFTRWLGGIFFLLTLILSVMYARQHKTPSLIRGGKPSAAAVAIPSPTPSTSSAPASSPAPLASPAPSVPVEAPALSDSPANP